MAGISNEIIDLSQAGEGGGGGGVRVPEGDYEMKIITVKHDTSSSGNGMLVWEFQGKEGKLKGKKIREYTVLKQNSYWKLRDLCEAVAGKIPPALPTRELLAWCKKNIIGKSCGVTLGDDDYTNDKGKTVTTSKIKDYMTLQDLEGGGSPDEEGEDEDGVEVEEEDDLTGLDRAAMKALVKSEGLEVKILKSMSDDDLRIAISEARPQDEVEEAEEDAEEEEDDDEESGDGLDLLDRAGLKAKIKADSLDVKVLKSMSEDDLRAAMRAASGDEDEIEDVDLDDL